MLRISLKSNFDELRMLYEHELREYILFNRRATLKLLFFATALLVISITSLTFDPIKHHIIPWHIISGTASLYFIVRAVVHQVNSLSASRRAKTKVDCYLEKMVSSRSIAYRLSEETIECYMDDELEYIIKWNELNALVEKDGYFFLFFNNGKKILVPEYAVRTDFYNQFLNQAKKNIRHSKANTVILKSKNRLGE